MVATPIARRMARELSIDLAQIAGSGPYGRIIEADVKAYHSLHPSGAPVSPLLAQEVPFERIPLSRLQLTTGHRMALSSQTIPQFVLEVDVVMSEAQRLRQRAQEDGKKPPSYSAILIRVIAMALQHHPRLNASLDGEYIRCYREINVGVAIATPEGLLVPVIHKANTLRLREIHEVLDEIREGAALGKIKADFLGGGTFTLSNLGMFGVDRFQALINPPEAAILAAGRIRELPWTTSEGVQVRPILTLRLSCDHRLLDGATAAPFLMEIKALLENPYELL
jgi:pyruvate dehydrogenase E2 component (dihydrolipoamide acetyltransferase)